MASICKICGNVKSCFTIEVPSDDEGCDPSSFLICGTCHDVIAEVSHRRMNEEMILLNQTIEELRDEIQNIRTVLLKRMGLLE